MTSPFLSHPWSCCLHRGSLQLQLAGVPLVGEGLGLLGGGCALGAPAAAARGGPSFPAGVAAAAEALPAEQAQPLKIGGTFTAVYWDVF